MSQLACARAMRLAERARVDLDEAERLVLERHVERCSACAERVVLLGAVVDRLRASDGPDAAMHARALGRAFAVASRRDPGTMGAEPSRLGAWRPAAWMAGLTAVAAAAAALLVWGSAPPPGPTGSVPAPPAPSVSSPAVAEPPVVDGAFALEEGDWLDLPGVTIVALERSEAVVVANATSVRIDGGALRFEVEPGRAIPFVVVSGGVRIDVLGTIFEVEGAVVRVERGRVRVSAPGRASLELGAGEECSADAAPVSAEIEPAPDASAAAPPIDARALFARARRHLASGEVSEARALVTRALGTRLPPALDAEGRTLLAECALVAGDQKEAARRYAEVARTHGSLPAGENALFAAARAAHGSGQTAEARRLLEQYLARYPSGQFVEEAKRRLGQLTTSKPGGTR